MAIGIGLDVGGTKVLGCALDERGVPVGEVRMASPATKAELVAVLASCTESLIDALGPRAREVTGVGVGLPGLVDTAGVLHETANIHGVADLDLPGVLTPHLEAILGPRDVSPGWRLAVDNDATCAAAAEHAFGAGRGVADSVTVTLGTGIGGGIVSANTMLRGGRNFSAEIGHMVVDPAGPECGCGRRGCWERFASGTGLARLGRVAAEAGRASGLVELAGGDAAAIRAEHVVEAAVAGNRGALEVVEVFGAYLALGLANLAEILDPSRIILGGGLVAGGDVLLAPGLGAYATGFRRGSGPRAVPVVVAELGERAGAFGAAALAIGVVR